MRNKRNYLLDTAENGPFKVCPLSERRKRGRFAGQPVDEPKTFLTSKKKEQQVRLAKNIRFFSGSHSSVVRAAKTKCKEKKSWRSGAQVQRHLEQHPRRDDRCPQESACFVTCSSLPVGSARAPVGCAGVPMSLESIGGLPGPRS